ncbi:hypothetical protein RI129_012719 [Pyrocoelia pectoralis]|uniref:ABC transporter domain-containing protein n=1 Tax=Pyrocoelia pectoralis TaxID=417401 RepID=A0AAN7V122_9COLE
MSQDFDETSFRTHNDHNLHYISKPRESIYETSAVVIEGAFKSYGTYRVLQDFQMNVPKGVIYGLLGGSGCGKTTVLECTIGSKEVDSGHVYVLGQKLSNADNRKRIGYMPQKIGLYGDLTVEETMLFFGRIIGMEEDKIRQRTTYLIDLLDLPHHNLQLKKMSGGQQRRVSLALAFLHEPELLILDEPTVGVDTVLRQLIWDHFINLVKNGGVTIIITTHYIEEARQANFVGIMRGSCLIAEESPKELLRSYQTSSLETVFLKLSVLQNQTQRRLSEEYEERRKAQVANKIETLKKDWTLRGGHMRALIWKNCLWFRKNWQAFVMVMILPVMMLSIYCISIGHNPVNFTVSIVNLEVKNCSDPSQELYCDSKQLSCAFLEYLAEKQLFMTFYSTEDDAIQSVQKRQSYASITIKSNYSNALRERVYHWNRARLSDIEESTIEVFTDVSSKVMMNIATLLSAFSINIERNEGDFQRLLVMGVNKIELLAAHIIADWIITFPQVITSMILTFVIFQMMAKGSILLTASLSMLTSLCGVCYGVLISVGTLFFLILTSGIFWPIEGMHWTLMTISPFLPLTKALQSLRSILHKGSTFPQEDVYLGFLSITSWILTLLILSTILIKFQRD